MKKFMVILMIAVVLAVMPYSVQGAVKWDVVGHNQTTISLNRAVQALGIVDFSLHYPFPDTIWVRRGEYFTAMTFGPGSICKDVFVGFDSTRALRWVLKNGPEPGAELVLVLDCNNVGIRPYTVQPVLPAPMIPPTLVTTNGCPFPWWWLLPLLLLIPLFWLWRRERRRRNADAARHQRELEEARRLAPAAVLGPFPKLTPTGTTLAVENSIRADLLVLRAKELAAEDAAVKMMVDEFEATIKAHERTNKEVKGLLVAHGYDYYARSGK
jgi:hypothetical protein